MKDSVVLLDDFT